MVITRLKRMEEWLSNLLFCIMIILGALWAISAGLYMGARYNPAISITSPPGGPLMLVLGVFGGVVMGCHLIVGIIRNHRGDYD